MLIEIGAFPPLISRKIALAKFGSLRMFPHCYYTQYFL